MELILVRHADAERNAPTDFDRNLSEKGRTQAATVGAFLTAKQFTVDRILTSPLNRAVQTAEILAEHLKPRDGVHKDGRLACGMTPDIAYEILWDCEMESSILLVGHEPDFSSLFADLVGMDSGYQIKMKKAAVAILDLEKPGRGGGTLLALVPPKLIG